MSEQSILVVGSMAFDDLEFPVPVVDRSSGDSTPRKAFQNVVGGAATYASLCASTFAPVRVVAVVGQDFPEDVLDTMRSRRIDTDGVQRVAGQTFRWSGRYHDDFVGRTTLDTQLNVFADFRPKLPPSYRSSDIVLLANIDPRLQLQVLDQMEGPSTVIADTMNFWITGAPDVLAELLKRVHILVINDEEARLLSGIHNISLAAQDILRRGPERLIIKRGEYGALYYDAEGVFAAPALPLERVADPTGAGDSFAGGLAGYLAGVGAVGHQTMRHAIVHGTATASCCVEAVGTAGVAGLTRTEVEQRVASIRKLYYLGDEPSA